MNYSAIKLDNQYLDMGVLLVAVQSAELNLNEQLHEVNKTKEYLEKAFQVTIPSFNDQLESTAKLHNWEAVADRADANDEDVDLSDCYADLSDYLPLADLLYLSNLASSFIRNYERAMQLENATAQGFLEYCADDAANNVLMASQAIDSRIDENAPRLEIMAAIRPQMNLLNDLITPFAMSQVNTINGFNAVTFFMMAINMLQKHLLNLSDDYLHASATHFY